MPIFSLTKEVIGSTESSSPYSTVTSIGLEVICEFAYSALTCKVAILETLGQNTTPVDSMLSFAVVSEVWTSRINSALLFGFSWIEKSHDVPQIKRGGIRWEKL